MEKEHKKKSRLSGLYAQRDKLKEKLRRLLKNKEEIEKEIKNTDKKLIGVQKGIKGIENREILMTTHFISRYIERVGPATEEEIKNHIVTPQLINMIKTLGSGNYPVEQYIITVIDNKLITIIDTKTKDDV